MTKHAHTIVWSETRYQIPSQGFAKVVRIGKGAHLSERDSPKSGSGKLSSEEQIVRNGYIEQTKKSKPTCS